MEKKAKTGGREKGTPNKTTKEVREMIQTIVEGEIENVQSVLNKMDDKERVDTVIKLLPYVLPRQHQATLEHSHNLRLPSLEGISIPDIGNRKPVANG